MTRSNNDDRNILPNIGDDPIGAAEALLEEFGGARKRLYQCIAKAVAIAEVLEANDQKWSEFKAHVARQGLHVSEPSPLRTVMCFLFKAKKPGGSAYDRACCYTRAVQQLCEEEAASAANIADSIRERGGIEELYAKAKAARAAKKSGNGAPRDGSSTNDDEEPVDGSAGETDDEAQTETTAMTNQTGLTNGMKKTPSKKEEPDSFREPRKYSKAWCEQRLILEISPARLHDALNMRQRQRGSIDFAMGGKDDDGFKIFNTENLRIN